MDSNASAHSVAGALLFVTGQAAGSSPALAHMHVPEQLPGLPAQDRRWAGDKRPR